MTTFSAFPPSSWLTSTSVEGADIFISRNWKGFSFNSLKGVVVVFLLVLFVAEVKQSQLIDFSLGLGLEFDNRNV